MGVSNSNSIGYFRLGFAILLALIACLSGGFLIIERDFWLGGGVLGVGVVMFGVSCRSYWKFKQPDVAKDERTQKYHEKAGFNAFWAIIFGTCLLGIYPIVPTALTTQLEEIGATSIEVVWSTSLCLGVITYGVTLARLSIGSR